ncbi:hypothetical protein pb186bvf_013664 [Paramecium bursaria]
MISSSQLSAFKRFIKFDQETSITDRFNIQLNHDYALEFTIFSFQKCYFKELGNNVVLIKLNHLNSFFGEIMELYN